MSAIVDGNPLPETTVKVLRLTLTADCYRTEKAGEVLFNSTYSLDPSKDPKQINIVGTEGAFQGKTAQGIYALVDDRLTLCYTMPGKPRPRTFESLAGSEAYLIVWKRQPPTAGQPA